jgi:hypothetical protein
MNALRNGRALLAAGLALACLPETRRAAGAGGSGAAAVRPSGPRTSGALAPLSSAGVAVHVPPARLLAVAPAGLRPDGAET